MQPLNWQSGFYQTFSTDNSRLLHLKTGLMRVKLWVISSKQWVEWPENITKGGGDNYLWVQQWEKILSYYMQSVNSIKDLIVSHLGSISPCLSDDKVSLWPPTLCWSHVDSPLRWSPPPPNTSLHSPGDSSLCLLFNAGQYECVDWEYTDQSCHCGRTGVAPPAIIHRHHHRRTSSHHHSLHHNSRFNTLSLIM